MPDEEALRAFVDTSAGFREASEPASLQRLADAIGFADALAVTALIAAFEMNNRIVQVASLRLTPKMREIADRLDLER